MCQVVYALQNVVDDVMIRLQLACAECINVSSLSSYEDCRPSLGGQHVDHDACAC